MSWVLQNIALYLEFRRLVKCFRQHLCTAFGVVEWLWCDSYNEVVCQLVGLGVESLGINCACRAARIHLFNSSATPLLN